VRVGYTGNFESPNTQVWLEEMASRGVEPVAISEERPSWDVEWAPLSISAPKVRGLGLGRIEIARGMASACAQARIDLLHNHQVDHHAVWGVLSRYRPRVITCWGSDVLRLSSRPLRDRLEVRATLRSADAITVGSRHLLDAAVHAGARSRRCVLVGWGADTTDYRRNEGARARIRTDWGFEDRAVVLSARLHKPLYHVDTILRAFALAHDHDARIALVVAGWGPETERLKRLAGELEVEAHVRFVGRISRHGWPSMPDVYSGADVFCSIPETDGGPLSVLEAMACELPVVVRDLPVMREWVSHASNGFIWDDGTDEGLARLLVTAAGADAVVGRQARSYVQAHHERSSEMDTVCELYERLVTRVTQSRPAGAPSA
jgi:L-malate glycosyltransferase